MNQLRLAVASIGGLVVMLALLASAALAQDGGPGALDALATQAAIEAQATAQAIDAQRNAAQAAAAAAAAVAQATRQAADLQSQRAAAHATSQAAVLQATIAAQATQSAIHATATQNAANVQATQQALSFQATEQALSAQAQATRQAFMIANSENEARAQWGMTILYVLGILILAGAAYVLLTLARFASRQLAPLPAAAAPPAPFVPADVLPQNDRVIDMIPVLPAAAPRMNHVRVVDDPHLIAAVLNWFEGEDDEYAT